MIKPCYFPVSQIDHLRRRSHGLGFEERQQTHTWISSCRPCEDDGLELDSLETSLRREIERAD